MRPFVNEEYKKKQKICQLELQNINAAQHYWAKITKSKLTAVWTLCTSQL